MKKAVSKAPAGKAKRRARCGWVQGMMGEHFSSFHQCNTQAKYEVVARGVPTGVVCAFHGITANILIHESHLRALKGGGK